MALPGVPWKEHFFRELARRNREQRDSFRAVFKAYAELQDREVSLRTRNLELEQERKLSGIAPSTSGGSESTQLAAMEQRLRDVQQQLTESYRQKAENAEALLALRDQLEREGSQLLEKERLLEQKNEELRRSHDETQTQLRRNGELEKTIELLRREVASLRTQIEASEAKMKEVMAENKTLINRILDMKTSQAEEMNQLNEAYQKVIQGSQQHASSQPSQSQESAPIRPDVDLSDTRSILDSVAWQSNFNVSIPRSVTRHIVAHDGNVSSCRFNIAGTLLVSGGTDTLVKVWDARAATMRATLHGSQQSLIVVAFSPDDRYVMGAGNDRAARVWSMATSRILHTFTGHTSKIYAGVFSCEGDRLITGSHDRTIRVWDINSGYSKRTILCPSACNFIDVSPNGDFLVSGHLDGHVRFWSATSGEMVEDLSNLHTQQVTSASFSADGSMVVTNSRDCTLSVIDTRTFKLLRTLEDEKGQYRNTINWNRACFSPDGQFVVAGNFDGSLLFWNVKSGSMVTRLTHQISTGGGARSAAARRSESVSDASPAVSSVAWNRNGRQVVSADGAGRLIFWES